MQDISGNVTGKIQFKIDKPSWDNLDKFSKKLTAIKRQMGGLDKTIKVQQVVNQIKTVGDKVAKASVSAKKKEYSGHIVAYQKYQQQMNKMYDRAIAEDRRRDNQKIRQAEAFNKQQLRSDIARDRAESRMRDQANRMNTAFDRGRRGGRDSNYDVKAQRYIETKMLQARVAGVSVKDQSSLSRTFNDLRMASAASQDFAELKHRMQSVTKEMISSSREARRSAVTFGSLRGELVQLTAAYTAFTAIQSIAKDAMELEGLRAAARTFAGTDAGVASHMTFIADEAERLGTNLLVSTKEFTKFAISTKGKVGENAARNIFSGVSEYAAVLQADPQQFERAFRAINQMLSKGNLMAEEVDYSFPM